MAKVIDYSGRKTSGSTKQSVKVEKTANGRPDRASTELSIGIAHREFYTNQFTKLLNTPTVLVDYYSINTKETTFSENMNQIKDSFKAIRYDKINNFVIYDRPTEELENKDKDDRELSINMTNKTSIVLSNTISPVCGDHLIIKSQGRLQRPFKVVRVSPMKFIDKEVWEIEYIESDLYGMNNINMLEKSVINNYEFVNGNVGVEGMKCILLKDSISTMEKLKKIYKDLNMNFTNTFYNKTYDILSVVLNEEGFYSVNVSNDWNTRAGGTKINYLDGVGNQSHGLSFIHISHITMQDKDKVLKYDEELNTLFIGRQHKLTFEPQNFIESQYRKMKDRAFPLNDKAPIPAQTNNDTSSWLYEAAQKLLAERDIIINDYTYSYEPKYNYGVKLFMSPRDPVGNFVLSKLYMDKRTCVYLGAYGFEYKSNIKFYTSFDYNFRDPFMLEVFDAYMDMEDDEKSALGVAKIIIENFNNKVLDGYNFDDYMGIPLIIYIISHVLDTINKDNMIVSY